MGRRSINTTKSGKYMNPTDQARKEARKKELKKNKKQRQMVRAAVLKNKDPSQILEEMEKIDEMEYNVLQPSPLNEKVLRDKRKKLKETFDRVMRLYHNDDPEHWSELKRKEVEYEKKRLKKQQYYESVKHAQSVQIDEIPLPSTSQMPAIPTPAAINFTGPKRLPPPPIALSLPPFAPGAPPGTLKKSNENITKNLEKFEEVKKKDPLSVPIGPPPDLFDMPDLNTDAEDDEVILKKYTPKSKVVPKPNSLQQRMLAISGQNIDEFMREMENVHKKKEQEAAANKEISQSAEGDDISKNKPSEDRVKNKEVDSKIANENKAQSSTSTTGNATTTTVVALPVALAPNTASTQAHLSIPGPPVPSLAGLAPPMLFRPPLPRPPGMHGFGIRIPSGPPPGPRPPALSSLPRIGIRIPGPPPGLPPRLPHHHKSIQQLHQNKDSKGVTTISAKPQIRNLSADVTRFVPSTLRVKREESRKNQNRSKPYACEHMNSITDTNKTASKDDAYLQFMNEMQGLL
uniref:Wbp11/ELF5/Saf1 N-terminal domain-containing protein n=1 Tax=Glossina austeni TaxID=7395 RepID=A0A1A9UHY2_GLOAU